MDVRSRPKNLYQTHRPPRRGWTLLPLMLVAMLVATTLVAVPSFADDDDRPKISLSAVRVDDDDDDSDDDLAEVASELRVNVTTLVAPTDSRDAGAGWTDASFIDRYNPKEYVGSMLWVTRLTGANDFWAAGHNGSGVDIALIDSGVAPVQGLDGTDKVVNGADLSFESQADNLRYLDTFGHGTHMAGIIAGGDANGASMLNAKSQFFGMAPGSRIVSVKVADAIGATDVTQVIAAIEWVIEHRNDNGLDIRVITLAYGTDGLQSYEIDPLTHAVERAWREGIVVVVSAGNDGNDAPLRNPAYDPFVIAVGAAENGGYQDTTDVTPFSNCGVSARGVDMVAPGRSIVSLRNPGSFADQQYPGAAVSRDLFLGSGTSQAAAVVSGAVALVLDQRPDLSPDQVKALLEGSASYLTGAKSLCQGAGMLDLESALTAPTPQAVQTFTQATGSGLLEAARGSNHVYDEGVALDGEIDIMGNEWDPYDEDEVWDGGEFNGASWSGASWSGASWSGKSWSGASWSGASWSGASWSGKSWSGASWSGKSWSGASWSGASWSGASWSGDTWSGLSWE